MKYFVRSLKYFLMLAIILLAITFFMNTSGEVELSYADKLALFVQRSGPLKLSMFALLAALYPLFGFVKRDVVGSVEQHEGQIIVAMESAGFSLRRKEEGKLYFGANTILRRVTFLFEDEIVVEQRGMMIHIEGIRRGVVYAAYCLDGFIKNLQRGEQSDAAQKNE